MQKADLSQGDIVAVYPHSPVPTDPYAKSFRAAIRRCVVARITPVGVTLMGENTDTGEEWEHFLSARHVIAPWDRWLEGVERRDKASAGQRDVARRTIDREAKALEVATRKYPSARVEGHRITIPVEDFLAVESGE